MTDTSIARKRCLGMRKRARMLRGTLRTLRSGAAESERRMSRAIARTTG
jgi:hypothetical protein